MTNEAQQVKEGREVRKDIPTLLKEWHGMKLKQNQIQREKLGELLDAIADKIGELEGAAPEPEWTPRKLIDAAPTMKFMKFKSEAKGLLGDTMPDTKDEIIAALKLMEAA